MMNPTIRFARRFADAIIPSAQTEGAAGLDLCVHAFGNPFPDASRLGGAHVLLQPGKRTVAWTGVAVAIPAGHVGLVSPRSGLALRHAVTVLGSPGVIDEDYRGEVAAVLVNMGALPVRLEVGMRVAQLVVVPCVTASVEVAPEDLGTTERGAAGFGSTGDV